MFSCSDFSFHLALTVQKTKIILQTLPHALAINLFCHFNFAFIFILRLQGQMQAKLKEGVGKGKGVGWGCQNKKEENCCIKTGAQQPAVWQRHCSCCCVWKWAKFVVSQWEHRSTSTATATQTETVAVAAPSCCWCCAPLVSFRLFQTVWRDTAPSASPANHPPAL